ncbi:MAG: glycosyltransferase family 2 protein [Ancalomicrobiaceae bacterium]|nr:glycosyltransferase family 2 protein [Ancalomicrobiaceae bacterium]
MPLRSVSLAAPAYNEAAGIARVVRSWDAFLSAYTGLDRYEIIVCNDGSKDDTGTILDELAKEIANLKPVHFATNQGAAAALTNAIAHTTSEWVLLIDSDGQFPIDNLSRLEAAVAGGGPAAIGVRQAKRDSLTARFGTWSSGAVCNLIYGSKLSDFNSALKLVRGDLLRSLTLEAKGLNYSTEVTAKILECGVSLNETAITHEKRATGVSSMKLIRGSIHRLLFVFYLAVRRALLAASVLQSRKYEA